MSSRQVLALGSVILVAALAHALLVSVAPRAAPRPLHVGHISGDIVLRENATTTSQLKTNGFRVECFEQFVLIHIDKTKEPTWTDNYVMTCPWHKIEHMTLRPE